MHAFGTWLRFLVRAAGADSSSVGGGTHTPSAAATHGAAKQAAGPVSHLYVVFDAKRHKLDPHAPPARAAYAPAYLERRHRKAGAPHVPAAGKGAGRGRGHRAVAAR